MPATDAGGAAEVPTTRSDWWRHPLLLAALSAVVAGAGQWAIGLRRRAWYFFGPLAVAGLLSAFAARRGRDYLVDLFVRDGFLWWLLAANLVLLVIRLVSVFDAYRLGDWRVSSRWSRGLLVALALAVGAPHAVAASYSLEAITTIDTVFVDEVTDPARREADLRAQGFTDDDLGPLLSIVPVTSPPVPTPFVPGPIVTGTYNPRPIATRAPFQDVSDAGERDIEFFDQGVFGEDAGDSRITILLAGGDEGPGRSGLRTDVMIVATLNLETGGASLFGLPRNLARVPLPPEFDDAFVELEFDRYLKEHEVSATTSTTTTTTTTTSTPTTTTTLPGATTTEPPVKATTTTTTTIPPFVTCHCYVDMLNSLYGRTRNWVRTFPDAPDPGMEALRRTISHLLDLEIDYYILVNMAGFVGLIDALGGVDVHFDEPMHIAFSPAEEGGDKALINVQPGTNHLSGLEALAYVRNRYRSSDYVRMQRQRCMIRSVVDQADFLTLVRSFPALAEAIRENARTNIPIDLLPDLFRYSTRSEAAGITTVAFQPSYYTDGRDYLRRPIPDLDRIRTKVRNMLAESNEPVTGGVSTESECS